MGVQAYTDMSKDNNHWQTGMVPPTLHILAPPFLALMNLPVPLPTLIGVLGNLQ
jgi:hypothetical protein